MLSSEWKSCSNCPPPCGAVPARVYLLWVSQLQGGCHHIRWNLSSELSHRQWDN
jgi:hypothetical protein